MKKTLILDGLECANCANKMERAIAKLEGVSFTSVNFATTKMIIEADEAKMASIIDQAKVIVKSFEPDTEIIEK
jgi:copper chaperone CopZ